MSRSENRRQGRTVTIDDVARLAGVSVATVSRALRDLPNVAPATRQRVHEAAERLDYHPDPSAARLATGRTSTIAMMVPLVDSWYFATVIAGVEAELATAGYELVVTVANRDPIRRRAMMRSLLARTDGIIVTDIDLTPDEMTLLGESDAVVVSVGMGFAGLPAVIVDDVTAAAEATTHLLDLGHVDVALLAGRAADPMHFQVPGRRREGFRSAKADAGMAVRAELEVAGDFTVRGGYEAMVTLLGVPDPPTAVFSMSDEMAFGAMRAVREHGLSVPDDISILGVDDHPLAWVTDLTTVDQQVSRHGPLAAQLLLDQLRDTTGEPDVWVVPTTLVVRHSTAPWDPSVP